MGMGIAYKITGLFFNKSTLGKKEEENAYQQTTACSRCVFRDKATKGDTGPNMSQSSIKINLSYNWGTLENGLGIR